jgi:hypothetical protein
LLAFLALNNLLYTSHISIKRSLVELCLQALLSDIKDQSQVGWLPCYTSHLGKILIVIILDLIGLLWSELTNAVWRWPILLSPLLRTSSQQIRMEKLESHITYLASSHVLRSWPGIRLM